MRFAVVGVGGVGGYFGGRLAASGEDVVFVARGGNLRAIQESGLRIESINGDLKLAQVNATDDPASTGKVDVVILAVKSWQVSEAAATLGPMIGLDTCVLPLQNGVEAADQVSAVLGSTHVLGGLCKLVSFVAEPGLIKHTGFDPMVAFNELKNETSPRVERMRAAFSKAGVVVQIPDDIQSAIWNKFVFIAPFGGVGAVTRSPAGVLRSLPQTRAMLEDAMIEILEVAKAAGVKLGRDSVDQAMASIEALPENATASMQRDIIANRPSELDSQNGAVVRIGRRARVPTPVNEVIYSSLLPQEMRARARLSFS